MLEIVIHVKICIFRYVFDVRLLMLCTSMEGVHLGSTSLVQRQEDITALCRHFCTSE